MDNPLVPRRSPSYIRQRISAGSFMRQELTGLGAEIRRMRKGWDRERVASETPCRVMAIDLVVRVVQPTRSFISCIAVVGMLEICRGEGLRGRAQTTADTAGLAGRGPEHPVRTKPLSFCSHPGHQVTKARHHRQGCIHEISRGLLKASAVPAPIDGQRSTHPEPALPLA